MSAFSARRRIKKVKARKSHRHTTTWKKSRVAIKIKRKIRLFFFAVLTILISALLLSIFSFFQFLKAPLASAGFVLNSKDTLWNGKEPVNILLFVLDDLKAPNPELKNLYLATVNPENNFYSVKDVSTDQEMDLAMRYPKGSLSHAYKIGNLEKEPEGMLLVQETVFKDLAVKCTYYAVVDLSSVSQFKNLFSKFDSGNIKETTSALAIYPNPAFYKFLKEGVQTNFSAKNIFDLIAILRSSESGEEALKRPSFENEDIRILVLNGANYKGLASWGGQVVTNMGLTLLDTTNAPETYEKSFIVADDFENPIVKSLAKVFDINELKTKSEMADKDNLFIRGDVVVVLGVDIAQRL